MSDQETINVYNTRSQDYATLTSRDKPDPDMVHFCGLLKKDDLVLDLGCGPAAASAFMREQGLRVDPVDASPDMVALANKTYSINARVATFDDIKEVAKYDAVWANFSLLHAPQADFPKYLQAIHSALKPNGLFHIGMKTGSGEIRDSLGRFYSYYSEDELKDHLKEAGFEVLSATRGEDTGLSGDISPYAVIVSRKGQDATG